MCICVRVSVRMFDWVYECVCWFLFMCACMRMYEIHVCRDASNKGLVCAVVCSMFHQSLVHVITGLLAQPFERV